jgi:hypothetical protein
LHSVKDDDKLFQCVVYLEWKYISQKVHIGNPYDVARSLQRTNERTIEWECFQGEEELLLPLSLLLLLLLPLGMLAYLNKQAAVAAVTTAEGIRQSPQVHTTTTSTAMAVLVAISSDESDHKVFDADDDERKSTRRTGQQSCHWPPFDQYKLPDVCVICLGLGYRGNRLASEMLQRVIGSHLALVNPVQQDEMEDPLRAGAALVSIKNPGSGGGGWCKWKMRNGRWGEEEREREGGSAFKWLSWSEC